MNFLSKSSYALFVVIVMSIVVSCNPKTVSDDVKQGSEVGYSLSLFRNLLEIMPDNENVTVSPYSAGVALSMLAEGAEGTTLVELDNALAGCRLKKGQPVGNDSVMVKSANSIWTNSKYEVKKDYINILSKAYGAIAEPLDFNLSSSVDRINQWARENTAGKIDNVVGELSPSMVAILANAVYFKGVWAQPFKSDKTKLDTFYGTDADSQIHFMNQTSSFQYAEYAGNQMIVLPYWGENYAMTVILPSEAVGTKGVQKYMNEEGLTTALGMLQASRVRLSLPKFKVEGDLSLVPVLKQMGVNAVFGSNAELGGISDGPLTVSEVNQKTFVNVDERGSEAAAVTTIGFRMTSVPMEDVDVKVMNVNRPFYYMISEQSSGRILFVGRISNLN